MRAVVAACLLVVCAPRGAQAAPLTQFLGPWRVEAVAGTSPDGGPGPEEAKRALGGRVDISATAIRLPDDNCTGHPIRYEVADADRVLSESWEVSRRDLALGRYRLGKRAGFIDATCASALVLDRDHLLMPSGNGFYLVLSRAPKP